MSVCLCSLRCDEEYCNFIGRRQLAAFTLKQNIAYKENRSAHPVPNLEGSIVQCSSFMAAPYTTLLSPASAVTSRDSCGAQESDKTNALCYTHTHTHTHTEIDKLHTTKYMPPVLIRNTLWIFAYTEHLRVSCGSRRNFVVFTPQQILLG